MYTNPLHTRSTSYLQHYDLIEFHTAPLGSNLSLLQSLFALFATCLAGMREAAGGRQPATTKPPWYSIQYTVYVVVITLTRIIKSGHRTGSTLELRNTAGKKHKQTKGGTRIYHS